MNSRELLNALSVAERLKDTTRHCYTSKGRHESVAEHSWMMTLMAFFMHVSHAESGRNGTHSPYSLLISAIAVGPSTTRPSSTSFRPSITSFSSSISCMVRS